MKVPEKEKKFTGYDFPNNEPGFKIVKDTILDKVSATDIEKESMHANTYAENFKTNFNMLKDGMRYAAVYGKKGGHLSNADFNKEAHIQFYGSEKKKDISLPAFSELLNTLEAAAMAKNRVKGTYKECEGTVKDLKSQVKKAESALIKQIGLANGSSVMKVGRCLTDAINASLGIMSRTLNVWIASVDAQCRQARAMAAFYVSNQPGEKKEEKKGAKNESAVFEDLGIELI